MLVATFGPTTGWAGKTITRERDAFILEDHGPVSAQTIMEYDERGHLNWVTDGMRAWVGSRAAAEVHLSAAGTVAPASASAHARLDKAREQISKGKYGAAVDTLWILEAQAREGDMGAAQGVLVLANELSSGQKNAGLREECETLADNVRELLEPGCLLRERVGDFGVSFAPARFVGLRDRSEPPNVRHADGTLWFGEHWIGIGSEVARPVEGEVVPVGSVTRVEVLRGRARKATGEIVDQAAIGVLALGVAGAVLGATTSRYVTGTIALLDLASGDAASFIAMKAEPAELRRAISPLMQSLGIPILDPMLDTPSAASAGIGQDGPPEDTTSRRSSRVDDLVQLSQLHQIGELTDEEFAAAKRNLLD